MAQRSSAAARLTEASGALLGLDLLHYLLVTNSLRTPQFWLLLSLGLSALAGRFWLNFRNYRATASKESTSSGDTVFFRWRTMTDRHDAGIHPATSTQPQPTSQWLEKIRAMDEPQCEKLVSQIYRQQGYTVRQSPAANPGAGGELILKKAGERIAVQCKHWKSGKVGVPAVREFIEALAQAKISRGILAAGHGVTAPARRLTRQHQIEILTETELTRLLETSEGQFGPEAPELPGGTGKFCPKCDHPLVLREAKQGDHEGESFWGCSAFPRCNFTLPINPTTEEASDCEQNASPAACP